MASSLNVSLTDELRRYVDERACDADLYSTPSEYIRDLVRRDMQDWRAARDIAQGLREAHEGKFVERSIMDIAQAD